ncbi:zinc finger, C3HC4 type (RING finger) protein [Medicago truncatula]|uniref:Zinc finger, C3HC4 type (RING finger) protein n=1 Tax=Medicago truncatula TaxID=3880 RepID=G7I3Z9_MEDTR|nr:zinc finger, C3HC4 type (RING finger) protein [Medicago truncatula]
MSPLEHWDLGTKSRRPKEYFFHDSHPSSFGQEVIHAMFKHLRMQSSGINSNTDHTTEVNIEVCEEERDVNPNSYPILLYSQVKFHKPDDSTSLICSICLGDYKDLEWLRFLPDCGHFFHKDCIAAWFRSNLSCPLCRNLPIPTPLSEVTLLATTHN